MIVSNGEMSAKDELERILRGVADDRSNTTGTERMRAALALWSLTEEMKDQVYVTRLRKIIEGSDG